jgi:hypothetical protein
MMLLGMNDFQLNESAATYLRSQLSNGHSLSARLLKLPLEQGIWRTFLPAGTTVQQLHRFNVGGVTKRAYTEEILVRITHQYLSSGPKSRIVVFEDALARRDDPFLKSLTIRFITHENEIYYLLTPQDADEHAITAVIRRSRSHFFTCVLTETDEDSVTFHQGQQIARRTLDVFARNAVIVVVSAYDGEADIFWERSRTVTTLALLCHK